MMKFSICGRLLATGGQDSVVVGVGVMCVRGMFVSVMYVRVIHVYCMCKGDVYCVRVMFAHECNECMICVRVYV